ncbi:DNA-3-methyladenine glycosylase 2 [Massilia sp. 9096]|uniref:DNA-3-methyladenine glycosylase 2 n=1 Tax=Massilia sp. 9096 TaxID=1500894 RepID=UPI00055B7E7A|nr:DNA-3-methyladenine glycosylase 2 [Massilia sp. 9096]
MTAEALRIALPPGYRVQDALAFHGRDAQALGERVEGTRIRKGVLLDGVALVLDVRIDADAGVAECLVDIGDTGDSGGAGAPAGARVSARAREAIAGMLGLRIDPAAFARFIADDTLFAPLVARRPGLRVIQAATVFEALTWAIIGQQINLPFAISLRRSFIEQAGRAHPSGLWCYPEAVDVARLDIEQLTSRKFSRAKAETLLRLARLVADGALDLAPDLAHAASGDPDAVSARLLAVKGIGPWTVNYALLRGYGYPDCSLHGDVAVRSAIGRLLGSQTRPSIAEAEAFLQAYRPHRTMAAAYLWASLDTSAA